MPFISYSAGLRQAVILIWFLVLLFGLFVCLKLDNEDSLHDKVCLSVFRLLFPLMFHLTLLGKESKVKH